MVFNVSQSDAEDLEEAARRIIRTVRACYRKRLKRTAANVVAPTAASKIGNSKTILVLRHTGERVLPLIAPVQPDEVDLLAVGLQADRDAFRADGVTIVVVVPNLCDRTLSDFDSTVVGPMPAADKSYEEMEKDIEEKYAALEKELDATSEFKEGAASSRPVSS